MKGSKKTQAPSGREQVASYLEKLEHPFKPEIVEVRAMILSACEQLTEHIKWNAPSFCIDDQDRITFNLHGKGGFRLIFHCGSKRKDRTGQGTLFADDTQLLEWVSDDRAVVTFTSKEDVKAKESKLKEVVNRWIEETRDDD